MHREIEQTGKTPHRAAVLSLRHPGPGAFVLRFSRSDVDFNPGQYVSVGVPGVIDMREYSVYSTPQDRHLEILVKEVEGGAISPALGARRPGDQVTLQGPFGEFLIDSETRKDRRFLFVATGSGIAPFRSFVRAYPDLDYQLLHGVRTRAERYDFETYEPGRYTACISRDSLGPGSGRGLVAGRVTDYLRYRPVYTAQDRRPLLCYLCGSCDMIYEVMAILRGQGVPREHVFAEVYY